MSIRFASPKCPAKKATRPRRPGARPQPEDPRSLEANIVNLATTGKLARISRAAIQRSLDRGIPITFKRGNRIIKRHPDGREELLATLPKPTYRLPHGVRILGKS